MEVWKDIRGYEGLYQVSSKGRIKSFKRTNPIIMKQNLMRASGTNYYLIQLWKNEKSKTFLVHRLVGITFIPNPKNKPYINHKDGNGLNNNTGNLEWNTHSENLRHAFSVLGKTNGLKGKTGNSHPRSCSVEQIDTNGKTVKVWESMRLAEAAGFNATRISLCCKNGGTHAGFTWKRRS